MMTQSFFVFLLGAVGSLGENSTDICCRCVKGTDTGSDKLLFSFATAPKDVDAACSSCCGHASTEYHFGDQLKEEICSGVQAQACTGVPLQEPEVIQHVPSITSPAPQCKIGQVCTTDAECSEGCRCKGEFGCVAKFEEGEEQEKKDQTQEDKCTVECQGSLEGMMLCCSRHEADGCTFDRQQSKCVSKKPAVEEASEKTTSPNTPSLCCKCVKGTDTGADALLFSMNDAPKDADAACNKCCAQVVSTSYQYGHELKGQFCSGKQAQDCSLLEKESLIVV